MYSIQLYVEFYLHKLHHKSRIWEPDTFISVNFDNSHLLPWILPFIFFTKYSFSGKIYEAKGLTKEALGAFFRALDLDPKHVPSLISTATVLQQLGDRPLPSIRCFLTDALQLDRTNHVAWFNLGLLYKEEGGRSVAEAAECFQAAAFLKETAPVEPFRWQICLQGL